MSADSWLNGRRPCAGDIVRMGTEEQADQGIELALLGAGDKLGVSQLVLPENGILYLGDNTELGDGTTGAEWQCAARPDGPEDVLFQPKWPNPNFFDRANWQIGTNGANGGNEAKRDGGEGQQENEGEGKGNDGLWLLDSERVSSAEDDVVVPKESASKIFIEVPATVHTFNFSGNLLSTDQLHTLPYTVEGQFLLRIGSNLGLDFPQDGRYQFRWPIKTVLSLQGEKQQLDGERGRQIAIFHGRANSNFFEPQFSSLCQFVACEPVEPYCTEPVKPVGKCCEQCGAKLQFRQNTLNFTQSQAVVRWFGRLAANAQWLPAGAGVSFVRIDTNDFHPLYQLSILGAHPNKFAESAYCSMLWATFRKIQQRGVNVHLAHVDYEPTQGANDYFDLQAKCSVQKGIIRLGVVLRWMFLCLGIVCIVALAFRAEYRRNARLRLAITEYWNSDMLGGVGGALRVRWQTSSVERVEIGIGGGGNAVAGSDADAAGHKPHFLAEFVNRAFLIGGLQHQQQPLNQQSEFEEQKEEQEQLIDNNSEDMEEEENQLSGNEQVVRINDDDGKIENLIEI